MNVVQKSEYYVRIHNPENLSEVKKVKIFEYDPSAKYYPSLSSGAGTASDYAGSTSITATGNMTETACSVMDYFISVGFTPQAAAGLAGNSYQESALNPRCEGQVGSVGKTLGLFQFEPGPGLAREAYTKWVADNHKGDIYNATNQCEYVLLMLPNSFKQYTGKTYKYPNGTVTWWPEKMTLDDFKKKTDPALAAEIFCRVYERASKPMMDKRRSAAIKFYDEWKKKHPGAVRVGEIK